MFLAVFVDLAGLYLDLVADHRLAAPAIAAKIVSLRPTLGDGDKPGKGEKALKKKCDKHLARAGSAKVEPAPAATSDDDTSARGSFWSGLFRRR